MHLHRVSERRACTSAYRTSELAREIGITAAGPTPYEPEWLRYRELYPDIELLGQSLLPKANDDECTACHVPMSEGYR